MSPKAIGSLLQGGASGGQRRSRRQLRVSSVAPSAVRTASLLTSAFQKSSPDSNAKFISSATTPAPQPTTNPIAKNQSRIPVTAPRRTQNLTSSNVSDLPNNNNGSSQFSNLTKNANSTSYLGGGLLTTSKANRFLNNNNNHQHTSSSNSNNNQYQLGYDDDLNQYNTNNITHNYNPEIGLRTGMLLGSMLLMIILYLLWRNRCRCIFRGANASDSDDYDMEYWLAHVDKQKLAQKARQQNMYAAPPQLPDAVTDRRQATAAWVLEHRKIWNNMHRIHYNVFLSHGEKYGYFALDQNPDNRCYLDNAQYADKGSKLSSKNISVLNTPSMNRTRADSASKFIDKFMTPFRRLSRKPSESTPNENERDAAQNRMQLLGNLDRSNSFYTTRKRSYEELDSKTQLIINYARIDAISNSSHPKKSHLGNTTMEMSNLLRPSASRTSLMNSTSNIEETGFSELNQMLKTTGNPRSSRLLSSVHQHSSLNLEAFEPSEQQATASKSAIDHKLSTHLLQSTIAKMRLLNRRRHSWPRAKFDHLHFNNINRKMRYFYQEQEKLKYQMKKSQNKTASAAAEESSGGAAARASERFIRVQEPRRDDSDDEVDSDVLNLEEEEDLEKGYSDNILIFQTNDTASICDNETTKGYTQESTNMLNDDDDNSTIAKYSRVEYV